MNMMLVDSIDVPYDYESTYFLQIITGPITDGNYLYIVCTYNVYTGIYVPPESHQKSVLYAIRYNGYGNGYNFLNSIEVATGFSLYNSSIAMHNSYIIVTGFSLYSGNFGMRAYTFNGSSFTYVSNNTTYTDIRQVHSNGSNIFTTNGHYLRKWSYSGGSFSEQGSLLMGYFGDNIVITTNSIVWSLGGSSNRIEACSLSLTNQRYATVPSSQGILGPMSTKSIGNYIFQIRHRSNLELTLDVRYVSSSQVISLIDSVDITVYGEYGLNETGRICIDGTNIIMPIPRAEPLGDVGDSTSTFMIFSLINDNLSYNNKALINEIPNYYSSLPESCKFDNYVFSRFNHRIDVFSYGIGYLGTTNKCLWVPGV